MLKQGRQRAMKKMIQYAPTALGSNNGIAALLSSGDQHIADRSLALLWYVAWCFKQSTI
jgi:hypothetical protein